MTVKNQSCIQEKHGHCPQIFWHKLALKTVNKSLHLLPMLQTVVCPLSALMDGAAHHSQIVNRFLFSFIFFFENLEDVINSWR